MRKARTGPRAANGIERLAGAGLAAILLAGAPSAAVAQGGALTIERAFEIVAESNPEYRQALNSLDIAGPQSRQAWGAFLPNLNLELGTSYRFVENRVGTDDFGNPIENPNAERRWNSGSNQGIGASITVFEGGRRFSELSQASAQNEALEWTARATLSRVSATVAREFYQALRTRELLGLERDLLESARRDLEVTQRLFEIAVRTQAELLGTELEVRTAEAAVRTAEIERLRAIEALRVTLGEPSRDLANGLEGAPPALVDLAWLDVDALVDQAVTMHPTLRASGADQRAAEAALGAARSSRWPSISLSTSLGRSAFGPQTDFLFDPSPDQSRGGGLVINASIPLFSRFATSYQVAQAEIQLLNAREAQTLERLRVQQRVRDAARDLEMAFDFVDLRTDQLALAERRLELVREEYQLGTADFDALQNAVEAAASARRLELNARYDPGGPLDRPRGSRRNACEPERGRQLVSLPRGSTRRPVAVAMLFLAIILLGVISFTRLPIDLLPDVSYPRLVVYTSYPDVAPAEVERLVTEAIEAQGAGVPGVEKVTSVSREGISLVTLRFAWGTDMDFAMLGLRERLDLVRDQLPESATRPRILRVDPASEPVMVVSVAGGEDLWQTKELAETVFRRRLEQLDGVAEASVTGGLDREIQVEVDPALLEAYNVSIEQVGQALAASNYSAPGGTILQGRYRYPIRTLGEFENVDQMRDVVVARQPQYADGSQGQVQIGERLVRLRDIGVVIDGYAEREAVAHYAGEESVGLLIFKESGANTVAVADEVRGTLDVLMGEYPSFRLDVASSQAGFIADSISNVVSALMFGGMLAFLVLFFFLRDPRYPVGVALAIPISVIGAFALMEAFDVSLNIMSLGGLALGVGMLVDNSIVVLENVFRHRELGKDALESAAIGAEEVQGAITASTLTTVSVFGPIVYVEGVAGELFGDLSLAVTFSLMASLLGGAHPASGLRGAVHGW